jgi:hypothetical protein
MLHLQGDQNVSVRLIITSRSCMMRKFVFGLEGRVRAYSDPSFFSETLNSQRYCDNIAYPFIAQLKEDEIGKA